MPWERAAMPPKKPLTSEQLRARIRASREAMAEEMGVM